MLQVPAQPVMVRQAFVLCLCAAGSMACSGASDAIDAMALPDGSARTVRPDLGFGPGGRAPPPPAHDLQLASSVALAADGTLLVLAITHWVPERGNRLVVLRYREAGGLDLAFGNRGVAELPEALDGAVPAGIAARDGRILVDGLLRDDQSPFVLGLTDGGALDSSFGDYGITLLARGRPIGFAKGGDRALPALSTDLNRAGVPSPVLSGLTSAGGVDTAYGTDGIAFLTYGGDAPYTHGIVADDSGSALVVFGGLVARFTPDGTQDASFGVNGIMSVHAPGFAARGASWLGPGVVGLPGVCPGPSVCVLRMGWDGQIDGSFGDGGLASAPITGEAVAAGLDDAGRTVAIGWGSDGTSEHPAFSRFLPDGSPDESAGPQGAYWTEYGGRVSDGLVREDGRVVLAGYTFNATTAQNEMLVATYLP